MSILHVPIYCRERNEPEANAKSLESIRLLDAFLAERGIDGQFTIRIYLESEGGEEVLAISDLIGATDRDRFIIELYGRRNLINDAVSLLRSNGQLTVSVRIRTVREAGPQSLALRAADIDRR